MVLFLDRVYGIEDQSFLLQMLEVGFLPDLRASASLDTVSPRTFTTHTLSPSKSHFVNDYLPKNLYPLPEKVHFSLCKYKGCKL